MDELALLWLLLRGDDGDDDDDNPGPDGGGEWIELVLAVIILAVIFGSL